MSVSVFPSRCACVCGHCITVLKYCIQRPNSRACVRPWCIIDVLLLVESSSERARVSAALCVCVCVWVRPLPVHIHCCLSAHGGLMVCPLVPAICLCAHCVHLSPVPSHSDASEPSLHLVPFGHALSPPARPPLARALAHWLSSGSAQWPGVAGARRPCRCQCHCSCARPVFRLGVCIWAVRLCVTS